ncbi:MAG: S-layer homology domain-containing protein [Clostridia bacterium]|nr:S-layer homology domain-containing protein [Clostridia bacterium]
MGLISGKGNGTLDPRGEATRAEMATMVKRFRAG